MSKIIEDFKFWFKNNTGVRRDFLAPDIKRRQRTHFIYITIIILLLFFY
jgi:hypothetical protein